jgi:hypothetical protein
MLTDSDSELWRLGKKLQVRLNLPVNGDTSSTRIREKRAKVAGTCVIADGVFQPSGISGKVTGSTFPEMPDGWKTPSAITHVPATFARFSLTFVLPSHIQYSTLKLLIADQVSLFVVLASTISTIKMNK